jgi:hypothetical protein
VRTQLPPIVDKAQEVLRAKTSATIVKLFPHIIIEATTIANFINKRAAEIAKEKAAQDKLKTDKFASAKPRSRQGHKPATANNNTDYVPEVPDPTLADNVIADEDKDVPRGRNSSQGETTSGSNNSKADSSSHSSGRKNPTQRTRPRQATADVHSQPVTLESAMTDLPFTYVALDTHGHDNAWVALLQRII